LDWSFHFLKKGKEGNKEKSRLRGLSGEIFGGGVAKNEGVAQKKRKRGPINEMVSFGEKAVKKRGNFGHSIKNSIVETPRTKPIDKGEEVAKRAN